MNKRNRRRILQAFRTAQEAWRAIGNLTKSVANLGTRVEQIALDADHLAQEIRWAKGDTALAVEEAMSRVRVDLKRLDRLERDQLALRLSTSEQAEANRNAMAQTQAMIMKAIKANATPLAQQVTPAELTMQTPVNKG